MYVQVCIPPLERPFTYKSRNELEPSSAKTELNETGVKESESNDISIGKAVTVPLGKRQVEGFVVEISKTLPVGIKEDVEVKKITSNLGSVFAPSQLGFFKSIADYYAENLSTVIETAIPKRTEKKSSKIVRLVQDVSSEGLPKIQKTIIDLLKKSPAKELLSSEINSSIKGASSSFSSLIKKNLITVETILLNSLSASAVPEWAKTSVKLTEKQQHCLNSILKKDADLTTREASFAAFVLHGVTGSGKTEIYIEALNRVLDAGKSALVIVPEISLTPQLVDRFRARVKHPFAVLHSGMNKRERWEGWQALLNGEFKFAVGVRSAVFAPLTNIGLIIVDEEHDESFKQSDGFRYHARDCAVLLAKQHSCPVVLGSATPSLESIFNVVTKKYKYLSLPLRSNLDSKASSPQSHGSNTQLQIVDLNQIKHKEMISPNISPLLHQKLDKVISNNEQAFILYNRRGFASYLQCERCHAVVNCPHCSVTLTFYQKKSILMCHFCNFTSPAQKECVMCIDSNSVAAKLEQRGAGTEKVYDELVALFPNVKIGRLDRDTARDEDDFREILDKVRSEETQILVGTKMIAKGHDLPNVTLVGIVDCDVGLHMPDFRASERIYQLLTQTAGRAGRGSKSGEVILQTRLPKHISIRKTVEKDFMGFAESELTERKALNYPPYSKLLRVVSSSSDLTLSNEFLKEMKKHIERIAKALDLEMTILGPTPCPFSKLKDMMRFHLIVRSNSAKALRLLLVRTKPLVPKTNKIKVVFDLDPFDMM